MKIRIAIITTVLVILQGCSAALVPYTSDPDQKLSYAYSLSNQGRIHPAKRLGEEALADYSEYNNEFGMAESHVFLAGLYKANANATNPKFYVNQPDYDPKNGKAVFHANKAIEIFSKLNELTSVAKTQFVLANFYLAQGSKDKGCNLYDSSLDNYEKGIAINPKSLFVINNPNFKNFPDMVSRFRLNHCN